jgi:hypothetical protein
MSFSATLLWQGVKSQFARFLGINANSPIRLRLALGAWLIAFVSILGLLIFHPPYGVDLRVYGKTIAEVQSNASPYLSGIARLEAGHAKGGFAFSFNYLYPPMTLPLLRVLGHLSRGLCATVYLLLSFASFLTLLWIGLRCQENEESFTLPLIAPFAVFFPGLLCDDVWLHGNIVFLLYALLFSAAYWGWKREQWRYFYGALLIATYFKIPMLIFLAIPLLSAAGQLLPCILTGSAVSAIYLSQRVLWPVAYQDYLRMMNLEFRYNGEFGFSPAGLLGKYLCYYNHPYLALCTAFYLCYATVIFLLLRRVSRAYRDGRISFAQWVPFLLTGVVLLYPRIKQYDVAALTLPMAILFWRVLRERIASRRKARFLVAGGFTACNIFVGVSTLYALNNAVWEPVAMVVLVSLFLISARSLYAQCGSVDQAVLLQEIQSPALHTLAMEYARSIEEA